MEYVFRKADVYVQGTHAGTLCETADGYEFKYLSNYLSEPKAVPVSLTLPLSEEALKSNVLFPFFDGLIPEGWLLNAVSRNWKIDHNDRFGLLLAACRDCIGDVYVVGDK